MTRSATFCNFIVHGELRQCRRLALPSLTLRARDELPYEREDLQLATVGDAGHVAVVLVAESAESGASAIQVRVFREERTVAVHDLTFWPDSISFIGETALLAVEAEAEGLRLSRATLERSFEPWGFLSGAEWVTVRSDGGYLTIGDNQGRLLVYDLRSEEAVGSLRL